MRIFEIKYMRRNNLGNYEHEEIAMTTVVEEGEDHMAVMAILKKDVLAGFGDLPSAPVKEEKPAKAAKNAKKEAPVKEEEEVAAEEEEAEEVAAEEEEEEVAAEEEEAEEEKPVKTGKKKNFKKKPQSYSRSSEQHKEILSTLLKSVAPDWKKTDDGKARAKDASQKMEGKDFLDEEGEVLQSFKDEVQKLMAPAKKKK